MLGRAEGSTLRTAKGRHLIRDARLLWEQAQQSFEALRAVLQRIAATEFALSLSLSRDEPRLVIPEKTDILHEAAGRTALQSRDPSLEWFSISQGTTLWNFSALKMTANCGIGCGPRGSSHKARGSEPKICREGVPHSTIHHRHRKVQWFI
jgi:hypothetical protein